MLALLLYAGFLGQGVEGGHHEEHRPRDGLLGDSDLFTIDRLLALLLAPL
jgi:hypothetical protein